MGTYKPPPTEDELPNLKVKQDGCAPAKAWHTFHPINCNLFHEIETGMSRSVVVSGTGGSSSSGTTTDGENVSMNMGTNYIQFLDHGGRRDAWVYNRALPPTSSYTSSSSSQQQEEDRVILKTLRWDKPYGPRLYDNQRKDALVSERLSSSPHVINTYGYCGMSTLNEFAGGGNFETYIESRSKNKKNILTSYELLEFARNISVGLADVHDIGINDDNDGSSNYDPSRQQEQGELGGGIGIPYNIGTIVHHDFRHHNLLLTNDYQVKLSDFNTAQLLQWNYNTNTSCGFNWYKHCGQTIWGADRSPEECIGTKQNLVSQKAEVYHLGALLHFILSHRPHPYVNRIYKENGVRYYEIESRTSTTSTTTHDETMTSKAITNDGNNVSQKVTTSSSSSNNKAYEEQDVAQVIRTLILNGVKPPLPHDVMTSSDPAIMAIVKARNDAMSYNVTDRPDARTVANDLLRHDVGTAESVALLQQQQQEEEQEGGQLGTTTTDTNAKSLVVGSSLANGSQVTKQQQQQQQQQQKLAISVEDPSRPSSSSSGSSSLVSVRNKDNNNVHDDDDDEFTFVQDERGLHKLEFVHTATTGGSNIELSGEFVCF